MYYLLDCLFLLKLFCFVSQRLKFTINEQYIQEFKHTRLIQTEHLNILSPRKMPVKGTLHISGYLTTFLEKELQFIVKCWLRMDHNCFVMASLSCYNKSEIIFQKIPRIVISIKRTKYLRFRAQYQIFILYFKNLNWETLLVKDSRFDVRATWLIQCPEMDAETQCRSVT